MGVFFSDFEPVRSTQASPLALNALARHASLEEQVAAAAYGKAYAPLGSAEDLAALSSADVDSWLQEAMSSAPVTAIGLGMEHAVMVSLAQNVLGDLAERPSASDAKFPAFQAGGVIAISGEGCAIAVPAPNDEAMARAVSAAVGGSLSQGLLVISGEDKEACTTQLNAIGDVSLAKVAAASDLLDMAPEALAALIARGQDPAALYGAILGLDDAAISAAHASATSNAPAAVIAA